MPQSLTFVLVHVIFSTKDRKHVLTDAIRPDLYAYLATVARNQGCECFRVGGVAITSTSPLVSVARSRSRH